MTDNNPLDWREVWKDWDWDDTTQQAKTMRQRLKQRAEQYATPLKTDDQDSQQAYRVLAFDLGDEQYAVDVMLVQAIRDKLKITPVPSTPNFYKGVVNIRGDITTVIDLRAFFNLTIHPENTPDELVIVHAGNLEIALLAHHIEGVLTIPRAQVEPMIDIKYTKGVTAEGLVLLDLEALFEDERLIVGSGGISGIEE